MCSLVSEGLCGWFFRPGVRRWSIVRLAIGQCRFVTRSGVRVRRGEQWLQLGSTGPCSDWGEKLGKPGQLRWVVGALLVDCVRSIGGLDRADCGEVALGETMVECIASWFR